MIFLTDFIAKGFKSFANKIDVSFDGNLIGIIGPNGSGKTNFIDGIKWVLGEQSNKELRSRAKNELIFHGSETIPAATKASVTLKFNNKSRILKYDNDEVVVTKTYDVTKKESTFYINEQVCTLSAVKELFANSGLTKGSLCIISNHSVDWFSNAKPIERKEIFIAASGVKPFLEDKKESIKNLHQTQIELDKLENSIKHSAKNVESLKKQVGEVELYNQKYENLKRLELNYFGTHLSLWLEKIEVLKEELKDTNQFVQDASKTTEQLSETNSLLLNEIRGYETLIKEQNAKIEDYKTKLNNLQNEKFVLKNQMDEACNSDNLERKIEGYQNVINSEKTSLNSYQNQFETLTNRIQIYQQLVKEQTEICAKLEQERKKVEKEYNNCLNQKNNLEFRYRSIISNEKSVRALMVAKDNFNGLYGPVQQFLRIDAKYEVAMSFAFGKTLSFLIVENDNVAKACIQYLETNKTGRSTFLPLNVIKPKNIDEATKAILESSKGFLGIASDLVTIEKRYSLVLENIVGNVVIVDDYDNAKNIARLIKNRYKVIDLNGNVFNPGGSITGGFTSTNNQALFNYEEKMEEFDTNLKMYCNRIETLDKEWENTKNSLNENFKKLSLHQGELSACENQIKQKKELLNRKIIEYNALVGSNSNEVDFELKESQIEKEIIAYQDFVTDNQNKTNLLIDKKNNAENLRNANIDRIQQLSKEINQKHQSSAIKSSELNGLETKYRDALKRIIEFYSMTEEYVLDNFNHDIEMSENQVIGEINRLKNDLNSFKGINFQAAEQLKEFETELNGKMNQKNELVGTIKSLNEIIDRLQKQAVSTYKNLIDKINETLPKIFEYLFNGGWCKVALDGTSDDIFEQGINVSVNPLGQKISSLYLLSSGQKTLVALSVLFAILKASNYPLVIFDEAEAALDPNNVVRFSNLIKEYSANTQFIVISHRNGTMQICDYLYGVTMPNPGVSDVIKLNLNDLKKHIIGE